MKSLGHGQAFARRISWLMRRLLRSPFGMFVFGLIRSEETAILIGLVILMCAAIGLLLRWIASSPATPDPWSEEVAAELTRDDCPQICHRCLAPHDSSIHFCSHCGAMVGAYTCLVPPLYLYAIGNVFRVGANGTYRRSSPLVIGYFLIALDYAYWVPFPFGVLSLLVYWKHLLTPIPPNGTLESEGS